jgi:cysteinyl-tRNA synthetase
LKELFQRGIDPLAIRLQLLSTHYRKVLNFTSEACEQSLSSLQRIKDFLYELDHRPLKKGQNPEVTTVVENMLQKFSAGIGDDLNISVALTALFEMIKRVNVMMARDEIFAGDAKNIVSAVNKANIVLGVLDRKDDESLPMEIQLKIEERQKARKEKNFQLADSIRDELDAMGIVLEDMKDGTVRWKKK